jgi:hypothetical protein
VKREELKFKIDVLALRVVVSRHAVCGDVGTSTLEEVIREGDNPVADRQFAAFDVCSQSRIAWECSPNRVVNFI